MFSIILREEKGYHIVSEHSFYSGEAIKSISDLIKSVVGRGSYLATGRMRANGPS